MNIVDDKPQPFAHHAQLRSLSAADFRNFGAGHLAYVRPALIENRPGWAVHGADGTPVTFSSRREIAFVLARQNDLEPVSVQ